MGSFLWGLPQNEVSTRAGQLHCIPAMENGQKPKIYLRIKSLQPGTEAKDGTVTIDGETQKLLKPGKYPLTVKLSGVDQTYFGNGPNLTLIAEDDTASTPNIIAQSAKPFAVSAIPVNVKVKFLTVITSADADPDVRGINTSFTWESDSGNLDNLNGITMTEIVSAPANVASLTTTPWGFWSPTRGQGKDAHYVDRADVPLRPKDLATFSQVYVFSDERSSFQSQYNNPALNTIFGIPNSGFQVHFVVGLDGKRVPEPVLTTSKMGTNEPGVSGNIAGYGPASASSHPGRANISKGQNVLGGEPDRCVTSCNP